MELHGPQKEQARRLVERLGLALAEAGQAYEALRELLDWTEDPASQFDPRDPANKQSVGGLEKLTPRGVEICYRLFDQGKSRYAVAQALGISFAAATHRWTAWQKAGGQNRLRQPLD